MASKHYLRCLGSPAFFSARGDQIRFRTRKHLALLVYLTVEPYRVHRRERLAELLWPKVKLSEARHSLATALSVLRARTPAGVLQTGRDCVSLLRDGISTDLDRLLAKDILGSESANPLEVSAFLDGFDIPDAPDFAIWKDRQQARLLPLIKDALVVLFTRCRRTGQSQQIEQLADRMLLLDDLSEEAIRAKMEARAIAGDRLSALRIYEEWAGRMFAELKARPSELIEQLAWRLRRGGWESTVANDMPDLPPAHGRPRPFVGRSREFGLLYEAWEVVKQGRASHVMILGDSGVGKTTLVERFTNAASLEGAVVCRAQAYDVERSIPFSTLGSLVAGLLDEPGATATRPEALAELGRTVPHVLRRFSSLPDVESSSGETARIRLSESFQELLTAIAEEHPLILVIDDFHLADEASLGVLHLVLRRSRGVPVIAIFAAREAELYQSAQATTIRDGMSRLDGRLIPLKSLDEPQTRELLSYLIGQDDMQPRPSEITALVRASGGVPMVLELLVQDWRSNGSAAITLALDAMTADLPTPVDPKLAYGRVASRLTSRLDPVARSVLELSSVLGRRLNDLSMYSVIDLSLGQTMAALGQLCELRLLREGDSGLEFANELIRAHTYTSIPSPVRKALHASVADRLLHSECLHDTVAGLEIAWHSMRAGRLRDAVPHLLAGAALAMRSGAPQSAELALATASSSLKGQDLIDATFLLVESLQEQGRWQESLEAINSLDPERTEQRAHELFALAALAKGHLGSSISSDLFEVAAALKAILRECPHTLSRLRAAWAAAHTLSLLRDRSLAGELLTLTDDIPLQDLDTEQRGTIGLTRAMLLYQAGKLDLSFSQAETSLAELRTRGIVNTVTVQLQRGLGVLRGRQGRYEEAVVQQESALAMAHFIGNDALAQEIAANLALFLGRLGRSGDQLRIAREYSRIYGSEISGFVEIQLTYSIAIALARLGKPSEAYGILKEFEKRLGPQLPSWVLQPWLLWKADALLISGIKEEAKLAANRAIRDYGLRLEATAFAGCFARWLVNVTEAHETDRAREVLQELALNLDDYDRIDQLEILCATSHLCPAEAEDFSELIRERLLSLPPCTWSQMSELGLVAQNPSESLRVH